MSNATTSDVLATLEHLRVRAETAEAQVVALVERMPLTADAQHAYESGLMARAENAEAQRDALLAACEAAVALEDSRKDFDGVAEQFYRETGFMRPGKDQPPGVNHSFEERHDRWDAWNLARKVKVLADLRAAIAKARGK